MKSGDVVRFKNPEPHEVDELYVVIEPRGDRVLVQELISDMEVVQYIVPTAVYSHADLEIVNA